MAKSLPYPILAARWESLLGRHLLRLNEIFLDPLPPAKKSRRLIRFRFVGCIVSCDVFLRALMIGTCWIHRDPWPPSQKNAWQKGPEVVGEEGFKWSAQAHCLEALRYNILKYLYIYICTCWFIYIYIYIYLWNIFLLCFLYIYLQGNQTRVVWKWTWLCLKNLTKYPLESL